MRVAKCILAVAICVAAPPVGSQQPEGPFRQQPSSSLPESSESAISPAARALALQQRFLAVDGWTFHHSLENLPADMRTALRQMGGADVVGPGETFNITDREVVSADAQHLYTATTNELGVVVWYTGGQRITPHVLIFDRLARDGCHYRLEAKTGLVLPIRPVLQSLIRAAGQSCEYVPSRTFLQ